MIAETSTSRSVMVVLLYQPAQNVGSSATTDKHTKRERRGEGGACFDGMILQVDGWELMEMVHTLSLPPCYLFLCEIAIKRVLSRFFLLYWSKCYVHRDFQCSDGAGRVCREASAVTPLLSQHRCCFLL